MPLAKAICTCGCGVSVTLKTERRHLLGDSGQPHVRAANTPSRSLVPAGRLSTAADNSSPPHKRARTVPPEPEYAGMPILVDVDVDEDEDEEDLGGFPNHDPASHGAPENLEPLPPIPDDNTPTPPQLHREYRRPYVEDYTSDEEDEEDGNDEPMPVDSDDEGSSNSDDEEEGLDSWEGISLAFERELAELGACKLLLSSVMFYNKLLQRRISRRKTWLSCAILHSKSTPI